MAATVTTQTTEEEAADTSPPPPTTILALGPGIESLSDPGMINKADVQRKMKMGGFRPRLEKNMNTPPLGSSAGGPRGGG